MKDGTMPFGRYFKIPISSPQQVLTHILQNNRGCYERQAKYKRKIHTFNNNNNNKQNKNKTNQPKKKKPQKPYVTKPNIPHTKENKQTSRTSGLK